MRHQEDAKDLVQRQYNEEEIRCHAMRTIDVAGRTFSPGYRMLKGEMQAVQLCYHWAGHNIEIGCTH